MSDRTALVEQLLAKLKTRDGRKYTNPPHRLGEDGPLVSRPGAERNNPTGHMGEVFRKPQADEDVAGNPVARLLRGLSGEIDTIHSPLAGNRRRRESIPQAVEAIEDRPAFLRGIQGALDDLNLAHTLSDTGDTAYFRIHGPQAADGKILNMLLNDRQYAEPGVHPDAFRMPTTIRTATDHAPNPYKSPTLPGGTKDDLMRSLNHVQRRYTVGPNWMRGYMPHLDDPAARKEAREKLPETAHPDQLKLLGVPAGVAVGAGAFGWRDDQ